MCNSLEDYNSSEPAMDQVHSVERDTGKLHDGVVATSQEEERNHVDNSHDARTAEEFASTCREAAVVDLPDTETNVDRKVAHEEESLQTARKRSDSNGGRELELAVMASAEERGIKAVLLEFGVGSIGDGEVPLGFVVET